MKILLITSVLFLTACSEHEVKPVMPEKNEPIPVEKVIQQAIEIDQAIAEPEPIQEPTQPVEEAIEVAVEEPEVAVEEPEAVEATEEPEIDQPVTEVNENETE
tara:strand:- start:633 stop:941 length:309 start_codon:yes stop_codon:yes gene_type:complete